MRYSRRKWLFAGLLGLSVFEAVPAAAQRALLSSEVAADTARQTYGPNRRHYRHLYVGYLPLLGRASGPGADLRPVASGELVLGLREKLRLSQWLALTADVRYARLQYSLVQNAEKRVPTPALHHRESLVLQRADLEAGIRLHAGRRGNAIGNYLDLNGWGGRAIGTAHHTEDRYSSGSPARRVTATAHDLAYLRRWAYGVGVRLGSGRYALAARYRLSDTFQGNAAADYPEMPRCLLGIELGVL